MSHVTKELMERVLAGDAEAFGEYREASYTLAASRDRATARCLRKLRVRRVDLVGVGANQESHVVLFKSASQREARTMSCPKCERVLEQGAKFCSECGERLTDVATRKWFTGDPRERHAVMVEEQERARQA